MYGILLQYWSPGIVLVLQCKKSVLFMLGLNVFSKKSSGFSDRGTLTRGVVCSGVIEINGVNTWLGQDWGQP